MSGWLEFNWKKKKLVESELEKIDGWRLKITERAGKGHYYENPDIRNLWKIYKWYLTKDSDTYNITFNNGYRILHRWNVVTMELVKVKLNKKDWTTGE